MVDPRAQRLMVETDPGQEDIRFLENALYEFNKERTGIVDGEWLAVFLRSPDGTVVGGAHGWTWGGTCKVQYLFVPAEMRGAGLGTRLMHAVEDEARARQCRQIVLETHSFQAPGFYRRLGFEIAGRIDDYPRGHGFLTFVKRLDAASSG